MGKLTQQDLVVEGFFVQIKNIGKAVGRGAKAVYKAAETLDPESVGKIAAPVTKLKGAYDAAKSALNTSPVSFVKNALKTEYATTFLTSSVVDLKETPIKNEPKNSPRKLVTFKAKRFKSIGSTGGGTGALEQYNAYVVKGPDGKFSRVDIRDSQNRIIQGEKETKKKQKLNWDVEFEDSELGNTPTVEEMGDWLSTDMGVTRDVVKRVVGTTGNVYDMIVQIANDPTITDKTSALNAASIEKIKQFLKTKRIVESSQLDTLQQIKLLAECRWLNK